MRWIVERIEQAHAWPLEVLKLAQEALHLTNTGDWVVSVGERQLKPEDTFKKAGLRCVVDLEWHKPEGGGGA
jgi:hypothetical protein